LFIKIILALFAGGNGPVFQAFLCLHWSGTGKIPHSVSFPYLQQFAEITPAETLSKPALRHLL
jgi:hypothetical protein